MARRAEGLGYDVFCMPDHFDQGPAPMVALAFAAKIDWIRESAGERFEGLELHSRVHVARVTDDKRSFADALAPALGLDTDQALASPHSMIGTVEEVVDKLVRQREELGISHIGLSIESMEEMAPVVARLAGT